MGNKSTGRVGVTSRAYEGRSIQDSPIQPLPRQDITSPLLSSIQRAQELSWLQCSNMLAVRSSTHILCFSVSAAAACNWTTVCQVFNDIQFLFLAEGSCHKFFIQNLETTLWLTSGSGDTIWSLLHSKPRGGGNFPFRSWRDCVFCISVFLRICICRNIQKYSLKIQEIRPKTRQVGRVHFKMIYKKWPEKLWR